MNLLRDRWLSALRRDGSLDLIAVEDIADPVNPVMALAVPRDDLRVAGMELLIGITAVALRPLTAADWMDLIEQPPTQQDFRKALAPLAYAFELFGTGPRFMQDLDPDMAGSEMPPQMMIIDAAAKATIKRNADHFNHRPPEGSVLSPAMAALALYGLQSWASGGGKGYRVGIRGGGPLTTLVLPGDTPTLWETILANIPFAGAQSPNPITAQDHPSIFPWLVPTFYSEADPQTGVEATPPRGHELQVFFGMPRPIRLKDVPGAGRECLLTGEKTEVVVESFRRRAYGNYYGPLALLHPLSPYYTNHGTTEKLPVHVSAATGWGSYAGVVFDTVSATKTRYVVAANVQTYRSHFARADARLMLAGYNMSSARVDGFISVDVPMPAIPDMEARERFNTKIESVVAASNVALGRMRAAVWYALTPNATFKGGTSVMESATRMFWDQVRPHLEQDNGEMFRAVMAGETVSEDRPERWRAILNRACLRSYDHHVGVNAHRPLMRKSGGEGDAATAIVPAIEQRNSLSGAFRGYGKSGKELFAALGLPTP